MATRPSFPTIPSIDLSKFDLGKLREIQLPDLGVAGIDTDKVVGVLRDALYVAIGFGVLTFQQAQVRRRELATALAGHPVVRKLDLSTAQLDDIVAALEQRLSGLDSRIDAFEARLDGIVAQVEAKLPEQAGAVLGQAHDLAKTARKQVRGLIRNAA